MTHHILIASEQLWPNLLGLAALIERDGGIKSLHIIHTEDEQRSAAPARQLRTLSLRMLPQCNIQLHSAGLTSQEVVVLVYSLLSESPPENRWSINATGGTKTMFAGLAPWVRQPNVEAFYREVTGSWFKLAPMEVEGMQFLACEEWSEPASARVNLPVEVLATVQISHPNGATWNHQVPPALDLIAITTEGLLTNWNWRDMQSKFPALGTGQGGFAFEVYFGALLQSCGAMNVVLNLEMIHEGQRRQEFDAIVSTGEKILVFDLKLTEADEDAVIDQISRLGEDRRSLGGLNAVAVAVRPNWLADPVKQAIAKSHQVEIWTQEDMANIIHKMRNLIGQGNSSLSSNLQNLVDALSTSAIQGNRIFSKSRSLSKMTSKAEEKVGWLNLIPYWDECLKMGKHAMVIDFGGRFLVRFNLERSGWKNEHLFRKALPKNTHVGWYSQSQQGVTAVAILSYPSQTARELRTFLEALVCGQNASTQNFITSSSLEDAFKNFQP
jgi:hypothetical protein